MALSRIVIFLCLSVVVVVVTALDKLPTKNILIKCNASQDLNIRDYVKDFRNATFSMNISNCRSVNFTADLNLTATRVDVKNVTSLRIEGGAFRVVDNLEIRGVSSLRLGRGAFQDRNVTSLQVEDSHVESLEKGALLKVRGMRRLELTRVTIGNIHSQAISYRSGKDGFFILRDSEIMKIHEGGLEFHGYNFTILNTSFGTVENKGINLSSNGEQRLANNTFINLQGPSSICINGSKVTVYRNKFNTFPNCSARSDQVQFAGNEFDVPIFSVPLAVLKTQHLYNNSFQCKCSDDFKSNLTSLRRQGLGPLLKNTFCISRVCPRSITQDQMLERTRCPLDRKCGPSSAADHPFLCTAILWLVLVLTTFS